MGRQQLADVLDAEMAARLLPDSAVAALGLWLRGAACPVRKGHWEPHSPLHPLSLGRGRSLARKPG